MRDFCVEKGISYHLTIPPQLNGVSERMIRTITEKARSMINSSKLNKCFLGEAVLTATYLINRSPSRALKKKKTPYEMWHNKKPILNILGYLVQQYMHLIKCRKENLMTSQLKQYLSVMNQMGTNCGMRNRENL